MKSKAPTDTVICSYALNNLSFVLKYAILTVSPHVLVYSALFGMHVLLLGRGGVFITCKSVT